MMALHGEIARSDRALKIAMQEERKLLAQLDAVHLLKAQTVHRIGRLKGDLTALEMAAAIEALELGERGKMDSSE